MFAETFIEVIMFCPNCGIESEINRKFCRSCGMSLEVISHVLTGQFPSAQTGDGVVESEQMFKSDRQKVKRIGFITLLCGFFLAATLAILGGAFGNLDSQLGNFIGSLAGMGGVVLMTGIGIIIYSLFLPKLSALPKTHQQTSLPPAQQPVNLRPDYNRVPVSSVTENTTELLEETAYNTPSQKE